MNDSTLIEVRPKVDSLDVPTDAEIELLASVLPELMLLMQQQTEAED